MRTRKGKIVAVQTGIAVLVLLTILAASWKDLYCHFLLDPRLVGTWEGSISGVPSRHRVDFDRIGNVEVVSQQGLRIAFRFVRDIRGSYRIDGHSLSIVWSDGGAHELGYELSGDSLFLLWSTGFQVEYRRVRDDRAGWHEP